MTLKHAGIAIVVALLAVSPLRAQQSAGSYSNAWGDFAQRLGPGRLVTVRMKDGSHLKGHLIMVSADSLHIKPKTRIAVPIRELPLDSIEPIEREREGGMSPGGKVALGVGIGVGTTLVLIFLAFLSSGY